MILSLQNNLHTQTSLIFIFTDIEADGVRVTPEQLTIHEEPGGPNVTARRGEYECEGDNYGMNDPEPVDASFKGLTWSGWKAGQGEVGTKVFTVTTSKKVKKFKIESFRPKYVAGWTIKENGKEVLTTTKGCERKHTKSSSRGIHNSLNEGLSEPPTL